MAQKLPKRTRRPSFPDYHPKTYRFETKRSSNTQKNVFAMRSEVPSVLGGCATRLSISMIVIGGYAPCSCPAALGWCSTTGTWRER
eukprot:8042935-Pyramimonas_sp.AAC.1